MVLNQGWLPARKAFLFDRTGVFDDNTLLDTGPDPCPIAAGKFLERFASYSFHFLHRHGKKKVILF